jgi:hypothetical protein
MGLTLTGYVRIRTYHAADGRLLADSGWRPNQITDAAVQALAQWLTGANSTGYNPVLAPNYVELGTGSGTPSPSDTSLFQPVASTQVACTERTVLDGPPAQAQWVAVWGPSYGPLSATEAGLFNANGTLFAHIAGLTINLTTTTTTSLAWTWSFTV